MSDQESMYDHEVTIKHKFHSNPKFTFEQYLKQWIKTHDPNDATKRRLQAQDLTQP